MQLHSLSSVPSRYWCCLRCFILRWYDGSMRWATSWCSQAAATTEKMIARRKPGKNISRNFFLNNISFITGKTARLHDLSNSAWCSVMLLWVARRTVMMLMSASMKLNSSKLMSNLMIMVISLAYKRYFIKLCEWTQLKHIFFPNKLFNKQLITLIGFYEGNCSAFVIESLADDLIYNT